MNSSSFIGIDIAQRTVDIAQEEAGPVQRISNTPAAIEHWLRQLPGPCRIAVESTGGLHLNLVRTALANGHTVYVLNPRDLAHYARSLGRRAKTDRLDARLILRYLRHEHEQLHPHQLPSALQAELDELIGRRHQVVLAQVSLRQSFEACRSELSALPTAFQALALLVEQIDGRMRELVAQDDQLSTAARHLRTMVGFGPLLSTTMAYAITRHPFHSANAFIAYIGYDPRVRESGQWRGRRFLSKRGPAELRRQLFAAALSASRTKLWHPLYQRYRDRGFSATASLVILARKLARIAFSLVRHNLDFDPQRTRTACALL